MNFTKIRNIDELSSALASGELPVDPAQCFKETLSELSGASEITVSEVRDDYAERLAKKIGRYLSLANVRDMDMDAFYNGAVEAMRPVRLSIDRNGEKSVWMSTAMDIGRLIENSCPDFTAEEKNYVQRELTTSVHHPSARDFEMEIPERGIKASGGVLPKTGKPRFQNIMRRVFATAALVTYLFVMPNTGFAQSSMQPAQEQTLQDQSVKTQKVLNTLGVMKTTKYEAQQKKLSPDIQDEYMESESVSEKLERLKDKPLSEKLNTVNDMWNKIPYMADKSNYGEDDHWASPSEVQAKNAGDCEDYAIGKYLSLRKAGVPASDMRILVGYTANNEAHAVLAVWGKDSKGNERCFILDNMHQKVQTEQSMVGKFLPKISLNENSAWSHATTKEYAETAAKIFPAAYKKDVKNVAAKKKVETPRQDSADNSSLSSYQAMRM